MFLGTFFLLLTISDTYNGIVGVRGSNPLGSTRKASRPGAGGSAFRSVARGRVGIQEGRQALRREGDLLGPHVVER